MAQVRPTRRSARVTPRPELLTCKPTAVHTEVVGQDTELSKPFPARGFGVGVIDQPDPVVRGTGPCPPARTGPPNATKPSIVSVATATVEKRFIADPLPSLSPTWRTDRTNLVSD
jgi:hypothetical protein